VYELASDFEASLKEFHSPDEVLGQFERCHADGRKWHTVHLQLYVLGAGPDFVPRRVELDPGRCHGARFRFNADGWGLVQFYLSSPNGGKLESSHTNHFGKRGAMVRGSIDDVDKWDFRRITAFSGRLNREIRKRSVGTIDSRVILPSARDLWNAGVSLSPYEAKRDAPVWKAP